MFGCPGLLRVRAAAAEVARDQTCLRELRARAGHVGAVGAAACARVLHGRSARQAEGHRRLVLQRIPRQGQSPRHGGEDRRASSCCTAWTPTTFKNTFNSFSVVAKVKRADELVRRYQAQSTPTVIVNGKYLTTGAQTGSYEAWFQVIERAGSARTHADGGRQELSFRATASRGTRRRTRSRAPRDAA